MLQISTKKFEATAVLRLQGQIVNGESDNLREVVRSLSGVDAVKLDLARVSIIDANGLGLLLSVRELVQAKGARFELANVSAQIRKVLQITRLDTVFRITSGVEYFPKRQTRPGLRVTSPLRSCA